VTGLPGRTSWPVPEPALPAGVHAVLADTVRAASGAFAAAQAGHDRAALAEYVAEGATDAFADAGSDTHRIVDLAAALLIVPAAGGAVLDAHGRPLDLDPDLTRRWSGVVAATPALAEQLTAAITR